MKSFASLASVPSIRSCRHRQSLLLQEYSLSCVSKLALSTTASSFFRETSGRSRRRQQRQNARLHPRPLDGPPTFRTNEQKPRSGQDVDTRTVKDLLFPDAKYEDGLPVPPHLRVRWPKSFAQWRTVFGRAWSEYKLTWNGFFSSRGFLVEDETKDGAHDEAAAAARDTVKQVGRDVRERAKRNAQLVKDEAESLRTRVRDATGIHSKEDLRKWVGEVMQLFSDCVKEFMAGYRKGRDDEVEKMLTEYFQELERSASTSPRRRRKRKRREVQFI